MVPPTPTTPLAAFTSTLVPASSEAPEVASSGAFEVDGWAEGPDFFFLGAMVDGVVKDEDGDEDDALRTLLGSRKRSPYLAFRFVGYPRPPMGPGGPLLVRRGNCAL